MPQEFPERPLQETCCTGRWRYTNTRFSLPSGKLWCHRRAARPCISLFAPWVFTPHCADSAGLCESAAALFPCQGITLIRQTRSEVEIAKGLIRAPIKNSVYSTIVYWTGKGSQETFHFMSLFWVRGLRLWSWPFVSLFCFVWDFLRNHCFHHSPQLVFAQPIG